jgi:hypothetical protein
MKVDGRRGKFFDQTFYGESSPYMFKTRLGREYSMIYRGLGFLAVVSSPPLASVTGDTQ